MPASKPSSLLCSPLAAMSTTLLNRVDLMNIIQVLGEEAKQHCFALTGFQFVEAEEPTIKEEQEDNNEPGVDDEKNITGPESGPQKEPTLATMAFYGIIAYEKGNADIVQQHKQQPLWFKQANSFTEPVRSNTKLKPKLPPPLISWSKLWPFLRLASGKQKATQELDIERYIDNVANGKMMWLH